MASTMLARFAPRVAAPVAAPVLSAAVRPCFFATLEVGRKVPLSAQWSRRLATASQTSVPEPPKRPMNAYLLYTMDRRPVLKKLNPEVKARDVVKTLGQEWTHLGTVHKKTWETAAQQSKVEYEKEKELYESQHGKIVSKKRVDMKISVPEPPKRPMNAYLLYTMDRRPALKKLSPEMKTRDVVKTLGQEWTHLGAVHKKTWETAAQQSKAEYEKEKKLYESQHGKIVSKKKKAGMPKRALSAYNIFFKEQLPIARQELGAGAKVTEAAKVVGRRWKAMEASAKEKYAKMAAPSKQASAPPAAKPSPPAVR